MCEKEPGTFVGGFDNPNAANAERYWEGRWRDEKAVNERLSGAVVNIAQQHTTEEMGEDVGDVEYAYDCIINVARKAMSLCDTPKESS